VTLQTLKQDGLAITSFASVRVLGKCVLHLPCGRNTTTNLEYNECQIEAQEFVYFSIRRTISLFVVVSADFPREHNPSYRIVIVTLSLG
jgi:hypothetical protein